MPTSMQFFVKKIWFQVWLILAKAFKKIYVSFYAHGRLTAIMAEICWISTILNRNLYDYSFCLKLMTGFPFDIFSWCFTKNVIEMY